MNDERAARWRMWKENPCWGEMLGIVDEIKRESILDEDTVPTAELNLAQIAEGRGVRKGLDLLFKRIDYIFETRF